jgi:hypothetical protein
VTEHFSTLDPAPSCVVRVLAAERTFWEKACLLHEETFRPPGKPRKFRMARHYYDLWCLLRAGVGEKALAKPRSSSASPNIANSSSASPGWTTPPTNPAPSVSRRPPEHLADWKSDYAAMLGPMFFGETPSFEEIITLAADFETAFNAKNSSYEHFQIDPTAARMHPSWPCPSRSPPCSLTAIPTSRRSSSTWIRRCVASRWVWLR